MVVITPELCRDVFRSLRPPVVVDDPIPERLVEPGEDRVAIARRFELLECMRECVLHGVFGHVAASDSALDEPHEFHPMCDEQSRKQNFVERLSFEHVHTFGIDVERRQAASKLSAVVG